MKNLKNRFCALVVVGIFLNPAPQVFAQSMDQSQTTDQDFSGVGTRGSENGGFGATEGKPFAKPRSMGLNQYENPNQNFDEMSMDPGPSYQVHVTGEVRKAGTYRVKASTRLSQVLEKSGGIRESGSERWIELRRKNQAVRKIDLLSFKLFGNLEANPYLLDNDVVNVPLKIRAVEIEGTVKRPGTYELVTEKTLDDLVTLAGGFGPGLLPTSKLKVIRFVNRRKEILEVGNDVTSRKAFLLENSDIVISPHFLTSDRTFDYNVSRLPGDNPFFYPSYEDRVFVLGGVSKPGTYAFNPYFSARQYLTLAGGTTKLAKTDEIQISSFEGGTSRLQSRPTVNPGDVIMVPEKYMGPETVTYLVLAIATSLLGITTTVLTLTR